MIINRYENATAAYTGGNDGPFERYDERPGLKAISTPQSADPLQFRPYASIDIHEGGDIERLAVGGLQDEDILDLSYLPQKIKELVLFQGDLTGIDLSKLPPGLETLCLRGNQISKMTVKCTPPSLRMMRLGGNPVEERGITLHLPLPQGLVMNVPKINSLNLSGGQEHPTDGAGHWRVQWADGTQIDVQTMHVERVKFDFCRK